MKREKMTSRERVGRAINHEAPDRVPPDLGSTSVTGIHVTACGTLERMLRLDGGPVRVIDPFQMLEEVGDPVREALGVDTFGVQLPCTVFGFRNENWKPSGRMARGGYYFDAVVGNFCDGALGDIGIVPGPNVKDPVGVRDPEEWYVSLITRKAYIGEIFEIQTDMAMKNLAALFGAFKTHRSADDAKTR
jgi:hypothetical protein